MGSKRVDGDTRGQQGGVVRARYEESLAADQQLRETVDTAIATGRWTVEDAVMMRQLFDVASPAAAREARLALARAVNQQRQG